MHVTGREKIYFYYILKFYLKYSDHFSVSMEDWTRDIDHFGFCSFHCISYKTTWKVPATVFLVSATTHTPWGASRVALTPVARTLSMEAIWISVATVPMVTMFTCAGDRTNVCQINPINQVYLFISFTYILWSFHVLYHTCGPIFWYFWLHCWEKIT